LQGRSWPSPICQTNKHEKEKHEKEKHEKDKHEKEKHEKHEKALKSKLTRKCSFADKLLNNWQK
jgi:hypothetical protein